MVGEDSGSLCSSICCRLGEHLSHRSPTVGDVSLVDDALTHKGWAVIHMAGLGFARFVRRG